MALTPAERMKKYRERLKQNPEKYENVKKKHAEYVKAKTKKIKELNDKEKEKQRKIWRNQKRRQNEKKRKPEVQISKERKEKQNQSNNRLLKNYRIATKRIDTLTRAVHTYRKRLYRHKLESEKKIQHLEEQILKLKARGEILEATIKTSYKECKTVKEKQTIKKLMLNKNTQKTKKKTFVSKLLGLKGMPRIKNKNLTPNTVQKEIEMFYTKDDISRMTAGRKQCRTLNKNKRQIRYLTDTVSNLYQKYREEGGKYSLATFFKYKPFFVLSPSVHNRDTCLCIKHSNMDLLFAALKKYKIFNNFNNVLDIIKNQCCSIYSKECMYEECKKCKGRNNIYYNLPENSGNQLVWMQWEVVDHKYIKTENQVCKELTTKKTIKQQHVGDKDALISAFEKGFKLFKIHHYNWIHQQKQYQECVKNLQPNEALIICDFSENYGCKMGEEVQATHFGASKNQITLHTGMIYWLEKSQSFCTIADDNCHEPAAIWAHLLPVISEIKKIDPLTKVIHFYSDGPTSQYRQKKNFYLLNLFTEKLKLDYSTWSYSEAGHGKGVADGIGGSVKRALDRQVAFGRNIENGLQAYDCLSKCMKAVKIIYIRNSDIVNIQKILPKNLRTLIGTMKIHQILSFSRNSIQYRSLSCFCGVKRGLCNCFGPKTHIFDLNQPVIDSFDAKTPILNYTSHSPDLLAFIANKQKSSTKIAEVDSNFQLITVSADVHVNNKNNVTSLSKPSNSNRFAVANKENIELDYIETISLESVSLDINDTNWNNLDELMVLNNNYVDLSKLKEDPILTDYILGEDENKFPIKMYTYPDITTNKEPKTGLVSPTPTSSKEPILLEIFSSDKVTSLSESQIVENKFTPMPKSALALKEKNKIMSPEKKNSDEPVTKKPKIKVIEIKNIIPNKYQLLKTEPKKPKSLITVVKRSVPCSKCKMHYIFNTSSLTKCVKCKLYFCFKCCDNLNADFICDNCKY